MRKFLKPFSFLPALLLMYMIYSFSAQEGEASAALSYKVSYTIVKTADRMLDADLQEWEMQSLANRFHGVTRKLAHMTEYFALAIAVAFPLYVYGLHGIWLMLAAGFICVGFACGDEYHQSFVAGRGPSVKDVLIDSFGVFWGVILVRIIGWTGRKTIFRPVRKKKIRNDSYEDYNNYDGRHGRRSSDTYDTRRYSSPSAEPYNGGRYGSPSAEPYNDRRYGNPSAEPYNDRRYSSPSAEPYDGGRYGSLSAELYNDRRYGSPSAEPYNDRRYGSPSAEPYDDGLYNSPSAEPYNNEYYGNRPVETYDNEHYNNRPAEAYDDGYYDNQADSRYGSTCHNDRHDNYENYDGYGTPYESRHYQSASSSRESGYHRQQYPSYHDVGYTHQEVKDAHVSDKLAEDMSFKKLMHDIKEQRKEGKKNE